eukprot:2784498-Amphidinium_carterae.1
MGETAITVEPEREFSYFSTLPEREFSTPPASSFTNPGTMRAPYPTEQVLDEKTSELLPQCPT